MAASDTDAAKAAKLAETENPDLTSTAKDETNSKEIAHDVDETEKECAAVPGENGHDQTPEEEDQVAPTVDKEASKEGDNDEHAESRSNDENDGSKQARPDFVLSEICDNPLGWGPNIVEDTDVIYQPFSKSDRLGRVVDWTANAYHDRRFGRDRYGQYGAGGTMFTYYHEEDESSFQLVDSKPLQRPRFSNVRRFRQPRKRESLHRTGMQRLTKERRPGWGGRWGDHRGGRGGRFYGNRREQRSRDASVEVKPEWSVLEEIEFPRLGKLALDVGTPKDIMTCGMVGFYDKTYDRISTKLAKPLTPTTRIFHNVTTTDDPIIRELARSSEATVFATDTILATLMCCPRSLYSWDIVVQRVGNKLFFDKRDNSTLDFLSVSETAHEPPMDDAEVKINSVANLAMEATYINQSFSQQVLKGEDTYKLEEANPFAEDDESPAHVGYRYRQWDLGDGINLVARCEVDAASKGPKGEVSFLSVKALNEYNPKASGVDWRQKLDNQKGAALATELKNNSNKLAKWTCCALLAGTDALKLGYVSRSNFKENTTHTILGTQYYRPSEFATQINLNIHNCWGIVRSLVDICLAQPQGKYLILKDPNKPVIRLYQIPADSFEDEESDDEDKAEQTLFQNPAQPQ